MQIDRSQGLLCFSLGKTCIFGKMFKKKFGNVGTAVNSFSHLTDSKTFVKMYWT